MAWDPENKIVKLCAEGMALEGQNKAAEAAALFIQAWTLAENDLEKFTAAHYVARHQPDAASKLKWDELALDLALKINDPTVQGALPSLYLNVAKGYEDLGNKSQARKNYEAALHFSDGLPQDGYGKLIRAGIKAGLQRIMQ